MRRAERRFEFLPDFVLSGLSAPLIGEDGAAAGFAEAQQAAAAAQRATGGVVEYVRFEGTGVFSRKASAPMRRFASSGEAMGSLISVSTFPWDIADKCSTGYERVR